MRDTSDALVTGSCVDLSVAAAWRTVDVWPEGVRLNGADFSEEAASIYGYYRAKLR